MRPRRRSVSCCRRLGPGAARSRDSARSAVATVSPPLCVGLPPPSAQPGSAPGHHGYYSSQVAGQVLVAGNTWRTTLENLLGSCPGAYPRIEVTVQHVDEQID